MIYLIPNVLPFCNNTVKSQQWRRSGFNSVFHAAGEGKGMLCFATPIRAGPLLLLSTSSSHPIAPHLLHSLLVILGTGSIQLSPLPPKGPHARPHSNTTGSLARCHCSSS